MDAFVIVGLLALVCGLLAVIACAVWWPTPDRRANPQTAPPPASAGRGRNRSSQPRVGVTGFEPATSSSRTMCSLPIVKRWGKAIRKHVTSN